MSEYVAWLRAGRPRDADGKPTPVPMTAPLSPAPALTAEEASEVCGDTCEPPECDWGWCHGETVTYRDDLAGTDDSDPLPVCQLHLDHRPDVATSTCQEDGAPWPCDVERRARRTLAEVQAERAHDPSKSYPECAR